MLGLPTPKMTRLMPSTLTSLGRCADKLTAFFFGEKMFCVSDDGRLKECLEKRKVRELVDLFGMVRNRT